MKKLLLTLIIPICLLLTGSAFGQVANDVCSNATLLTASTDTSCVPVLASFADALEESAPSSCPGVDDSPNAFDTWYKFTANDPKQIIDVTTLAAGGFGGGVGAVVVLYDGCGGAEIACGNPNVLSFGGFTIVQSGLTRITADGLTIGSTYFIRVYNYGDTLPAAGSDEFEICVHQAPAPPANDECSTAASLTVGTACVPTSGTLDGANQEGAPNACGADPASGTALDVWYSFVANQSNEIIEVSPAGAGGPGGGGIAPVIEVYDACAGALLDCAGPTIFPFIGAVPGTTVLNRSGYTPGNTYFVRVYHYGDEASTDGALNICVYDAPPPPANDDCANAIMLTVLDTCNPTSGTMMSAVQENAPNACDAQDPSPTANDVWYSFVAVNATHLVDVAALGGFQDGVAAVIEVYDACGGAQIACANPNIIGGVGPVAGTTTLTASGLTPGSTYYIRTYHYGEDPAANGEFEICVYNAPPPPVNDTCSGAEFLVVTPNCDPTNGDLTTATQESTAEDCNGATSTTANDVWYTFNATNASTIIEAAGDAIVVVVYDACGGNLVDCANPDGSGLTFLELGGLNVGSNYFIRVYNDGPGGGEFQICVHDLPPTEPNDECSNAISITQVDSKAACSPIPVSTVNATQSAEPTTCAQNAIDDDVWYKFLATSTEVVAWASGKSQDLVATNIGFALYAGSCGGAQAPECSQGAQGDSLVFRNLTIGQTYYLRTYTRGNMARGTYDLCVYKFTPPPAPANDLCAGAITVTPTQTDTCISPLQSTLAAANQENPVDSCNGDRASASAKDVWFKFTAIADAQDIEVKSLGGQTTGTAAVVALYSSNGGNCGSFIECKSPQLLTFGGQTFGVPGTTKLKALGLTVGNTYFVRVFHWGANVPTQPNFTICIFRDSAATSGISDPNALEQSFNLFPNPTRNNVELSFSVTSKVTVKVMSLTGQVVFTETIDQVNGTYRRNIDLSTAAKGIYMVQVVTDKETITRKVIRE